MARPPVARRTGCPQTATPSHDPLYYFVAICQVSVIAHTGLLQSLTRGEAFPGSVCKSKWFRAS